MTTIEKMRTLLRDCFGGVIRSGKHNENGQCCILELVTAARGAKWSDSPDVARCFDLRRINDAPWSSDAVRTEHMLRLYEAYEGSLDWPLDRQIKCVERLAILTVNRVVSELPGLPDNVRSACRAATTLSAAASAASADSAADNLLIRVVDLWIEAANESIVERGDK